MFQDDDESSENSSNTESEESILVRMKSEAITEEDPLTANSSIAIASNTITSTVAKSESNSDTNNELPIDGMECECVSVEKKITKKYCQK